jgi:predicted phage terminase large subunit-like protein
MKVIRNRTEYHSFLRQDLYAFTARCFYELNPTTRFVANWHLEVIAAELDACRRGETTRLIINVPPRSLKSLCANAFVAFLLGKDPSAQVICASYAQELASKLAADCRTILTSPFYQDLFPRTRLAHDRKAVHDFTTTQQGFRLSTSVGGVLTGRGADFIIIDDPLKPDEALSETQRKAVNDWYDNTLYSRLNDKRNGCIILIMQRLHEDDLVGHVLGMEPWKVIRFPAIAEEDETHAVKTHYGEQCFRRRTGEPLHLEREPLDVLNRIREAQGEYNFAGQYQQAPAPLGGGLVKVEWFKRYSAGELPSKFDQVFQSWDTANKPTELSDFSVCTTWGVKEKHIYLLHVYRRRLGYPDLKRAVREQATAFSPSAILIEDRASGTQLIQELVGEGMHAIKRYEPAGNKVMRLHAASNVIENADVYLPERAPWLGEFLHELATFPNGKYDDQADSVSQALDWFRQATPIYGALVYFKQLEAERKQPGRYPASDSPLVNRGALLREWDRQR